MAITRRAEDITSLVEQTLREFLRDNVSVEVEAYYEVTQVQNIDMIEPVITPRVKVKVISCY